MNEWIEEGKNSNLNSPAWQEIDKEKEIKECKKAQFLYFVNTETGELVKGRCKTYRCDYCGPRKARKLQNAFYEYFKQFKIIRFWTFTFSEHLFVNLDVNKSFKLASEIWRRFINNARRDTRLSKYDRSFQYVKVAETQKNGSPHYHVFFDRWIARYIINDIWESVIRLYYSNQKKVGNAYVEGIISCKDAAKYISKYMIKTVKSIQVRIRFRVWSKSGRVALFEKIVRKEVWLKYKSRQFYLYLSSLRVTSQTNEVKVEDFALFEHIRSNNNDIITEIIH